jgi:hypothetical protein
MFRPDPTPADAGNWTTEDDPGFGVLFLPYMAVSPFEVWIVALLQSGCD